MRRRTVGLLAALALVAAAPAAQAPAGVPGSPAPVVAAKTCRSGYTHAVILGVQKCLKIGQYCTHTKAANHDYRRYGFHCGRRDSNSRYHLTYS